MIGQVQEFVAERAALLFGRVNDARRTSVASARGAVRNSAETIKQLRSPVQTVSRSGIKLTAVTQTLSQNLIELQTEIVGAAMSDAAQRLERAAGASSLGELVRGQVELLPATRKRLVHDTRRSVELFRDAGRELRTVATQTYRQIVESRRPAAAKPKQRAKPARKRATRSRKAA